MVLLGLVLVILAVGAAAVVLVDSQAFNSGDATITLLGRTFSDLTVGEIFLAGLGVTLVFTLGLLAMSAGAKRTARVRRRTRELRAERDQQISALEEERARLRDELDRQHHDDTTTVREHRDDTVPAREHYVREPDDQRVYPR